MRYEITLETELGAEALEATVRSLTLSSPFDVSVKEARGTGALTVGLVPRSPGLAVSFTKVAELQLLLARHAEILSVLRTDRADLAAAS